ncbi:MAG: dTMP kinase [Candidatus Omnitrophota bacterium]
MKKGILITLEGNEGSGKSTQIKLLGAYLRKKGYSVFLTREPGGTKVSDGIRKILLDPRNKNMTPLCETLLYMASRTQLVEEVIRPQLKKGRIVLCDRWLDATVAYQGYGGGVDVRWIKALGETATQGVRPRLSLFLDLPLEAGLRRAKSHKAADRMERKKLAYHRRVRRGYYAIAKAAPGRFQIVKVKEGDPVQAVHEKIRKAARRVLG